MTMEKTELLYAASEVIVVLLYASSVYEKLAPFQEFRPVPEFDTRLVRILR